MRTPLRPVKRFIRHLWFRMRHGWWPAETWNLDHELAAWLVPRLRYFKQHTHGYPSDITAEAWDGILDAMIDGFEAHLREWTDGTPEDQVKAARAFELLGVWGEHLWD